MRKMQQTFGVGMKRLLHIIATPRGDESRTLQVSEAFLEVFAKSHPDWIIDHLDLAKEELPALTAKSVSGKYVLLQGKDLYGGLKEAWQEILQHIERFKTADIFLVSSPMWNYSVPYLLKQYIDLIVQPKYLFRYTDKGEVEGLVKNKKMIAVLSRGGQYQGNMAHLDFQEPYLRTVFKFVGIEDFTPILVEPMDMGVDRQKAEIEKAKEVARKLGAKG